ncbi:hypothetical protein PFISCL1PPCAC_4608, partial [Pristionchus fissidentatus]
VCCCYLRHLPVSLARSGEWLLRNKEPPTDLRFSLNSKRGVSGDHRSSDCPDLCLHLARLDVLPGHIRIRWGPPRKHK